MVGVITQRGPHLADGSVDAMLGVHEDVFTPEPFDDLRTRHHPPLTLNEQGEQLQRNPLDLHGLPMAPQLEAMPVEFKFAESVNPVLHKRTAGKGEPL